MNSKETMEYSYLINKGILNENNEFKKGNIVSIKYDFNCKEYKILKEKYKLEKIAKNGTEFEKGKRLTNYFSKRLKHDPMYDNHIPSNSLDLLEYAFNKENGINCLNKSKIMTEIFLSLGIKARRVTIMPYSSYDTDNHVVTEIFDNTLNKWIMLDPTTNGMFIDINKTPLSLLEIREHFSNNKFITFVKTNDKLDDLEKLSNKYLAENWYICKNSFRYFVEKYQGFGIKENNIILNFVPKNFSIKEWEINNYKFRIDTFKNEYPKFAKVYQERLEKTKSSKEKIIYSIEILK